MSALNPYFYAHNAEHLAYENAWVRFLKEGVLPENNVLRDEVKSSWQRCKSIGIDALSEEKLPLLSKEDLKSRVEANKNLLALVAPFLATLFGTVEDSGFRVDFIDRDGYILKSLSNDYLDKQNAHTNSFEGANRSEAVAGTNAIGLSIITKNPILTCYR